MVVSTPGVGHLARLVARHPDGWASLAILLLSAAVFGRGLVPGHVLSPADLALAAFPWNAGIRPANPLATDVAFMFHPWLVYAAREVAAGHFPLWNPHVFTGVPFFANPQTALLFPLTALAYVMPVTTAITVGAILKLAMAGLGTYWFLRPLGVTPWPALVGAVTFMLSGVMAVWLHWSYASAVALFPALLAATERVHRRGNAVSVAIVAGVVTLLVFAGYPQGAALAGLLAGAWALLRARTAPRPGRFVLLWGGGAALGLAGAAIQLLPFLDYLRASAVLAHRHEWMWRLAVPPRGVIATLMPFYYGSPMGGDFWGPLNFNEMTTSVGLVPWLLLPLAVVAGWRDARVRFFLALGALAAMLVFGVPLAGTVLAGLPPFSMIIPTRMASFLALALAVLSALGLQAALDAPPEVRERARRATRLGFVALVVVAFAFVASDALVFARRPMRLPITAQYVALLGVVAAGMLLTVRLLVHGGGAARWVGLLGVQLAAAVPLVVASNPVIDARLFYPDPPPLVRYLKETAAREHGRVLFNVPMVPNLGVIFGLDEVGGYDGITPRRIGDLVDPAGSLDSLGSGVLHVTTGLDSPLVDLVGIRHVAVPPGARPPASWPVEWQGPGGSVYTNPDAVPRAFLVFQARTCVDDAQALALLREGRMDPTQEVLVAICDGIPAVGPRGTVADVDIREHAAGRVAIRTSADAAAWLVLTDAWFPGWRAWVDGREQPVARANYGFRAIWLPAGRHEVEFRYRPRSLSWGAALSLGAAVFAVGLVWRGRVRP